MTKKITCPENYELNGKECITVVEEQLITKKICDDGYQLVDDKCIKETIIEPKKEYVCESGYFITGVECTKFIMQSAPITSYTCQEGYKLEGSICKKYISYTPSWNNSSFSFWCNQGGELLEGVGCVTSVSSISAIPTYGKCPEGYDSRGQLCEKYDKKVPVETLRCDNDYILKNNNCMKTEYLEPSVVLTCKDDFIQVGNICKKEIKTKPIKQYKN